MTVTVTVDDAALREFLTGSAGPIFRLVHDVTERVRNTAVRRCPRDTGMLAASIEMAVNVYGYDIVGIVGSRLDYALYRHEGTGIYGPEHRPIVPVRAKVLAFKPGRLLGPLPAGQMHPSPEKRGGLIFARSVRGTMPSPFLRSALEDESPWPVNPNPLP